MRIIFTKLNGCCATCDEPYRRYRRGDTIIEVIFAITVFSFVSILTINLMNSGIAVTQSNLEMTTSSTEMSAQSAALRFVHNGFAAEYQYPEIANYVPVWDAITNRAIDADKLLDIRDISDCNDIYNDANFISKQKPFVINTRRLNTDADLAVEQIHSAVVIPTASATAATSTAPFVSPPVNARIIFGSAADNSDELQEAADYRNVASVEGIWVTAVRGDVHTTRVYDYKEGKYTDVDIPRYYDLYIRTCWTGTGRQYPTKLQSIVRLYNPISEEGSELDEARPE